MRYLSKMFGDQLKSKLFKVKDKEGLLEREL